eukprot:3295429-Rhodomonas_salina.1
MRWLSPGHRTSHPKLDREQNLPSAQFLSYWRPPCPESIQNSVCSCIVVPMLLPTFSDFCLDLCWEAEAWDQPSEGGTRDRNALLPLFG